MTARELILEAIGLAQRPLGVDLPGAEPPEQASAYRAALKGDLVGGFIRRAEELGVGVHRVRDLPAAARVVAGLCGEKPTYVEPALGQLLPTLQELGVAVVSWDRLAQAEVGVTGADYALAESGTLVLLAGPHRPRAGSLLPPVHVAVLWEDHILADLFDLVTRLGSLPPTLVLSTGPSRSADIEMSLAVGVHGPGTVHVVLVYPGQEAQGALEK